MRLTLVNKILRKIRKIFYLNQIWPGPRFGRLLTIVIYRIYEAVKTDEELLIILLLFKDILSVDATKHHMVDASS